PTRLRAAASAATREQPSGHPKPIRARLDQSADTASARSSAYSTVRASIETPPRATPTTAGQAPPRKPRDDEDPIGPQITDRPLTDQPGERRIFNRITVGAIAAIALVLVVGAVVAYLLIPDLAPNFADDSVDPALLPNTSRVAAGTPVSAIAAPRVTAGAAAVKPQSAANPPEQATAVTVPTQSAAQPTAIITPAAQPTTATGAAPTSV